MSDPRGVSTGAPAEDPPAESRREPASGLVLRNVTKVFPGGVVAVDDVSLEIASDEYVVLLGPSGCGKTTMLRMIGGHETPTSGDIVLDGQRLNDVPPDKRPTTTVFQHFALFPHRTVVQNVEFGLKMQRVAKDERRARAVEALDTVGLRDLAERRPAELSGGQQQRVALARVLVTHPQALLLDEPLGDLDRLLRLRMRVELRNLQRSLGLTFVHVTHDQEEALSVADRIVVMHEGRIAQVGDPFTISTRPESAIVAAFMGDNNILGGKVTAREGDRVEIEAGHGIKVSALAPGSDLAVGAPASVSVAAAAVRMDDATGGPTAVNELEADVAFVEYVGDLVKLHLSAHGERFLAKLPAEEYPALRGKEGSPVRISWKEEDVQVLRL